MDPERAVVVLISMAAVMVAVALSLVVLWVVRRTPRRDIALKRWFLVNIVLALLLVAVANLLVVATTHFLWIRWVNGLAAAVGFWGALDFARKLPRKP